MQKKHEHYFYSTTLSTCPECLELVYSKILIKDDKVYFKKFCKIHGITEALVSEDAKYYINTSKYIQPGSIPNKFLNHHQKGCPSDCGLCDQHEQHTCHPIIEITDHCNLNCSICFANNNHSNNMDINEFKKIVENLIINEDKLENITLSGGEPTLHPEFWKLIEVVKHPKIARISFVTNGLKIASDLDFCRKIKENNLYVILQHDGFDDKIYNNLRGKNLLETKNKALENLEKFDISTQLIFVAAKYINDNQFDLMLKLLIEKDFILSLAIQPLSLQGKNGGKYNHDVLDRITIPGVIKKLAEQSNSLLKQTDFFPLPCPNPQCVSLTYLLKIENNEYLPITRFIDIGKYLNIFSSSATLPPNKETEEAFHEIITDLWSTKGEDTGNEKVINALKRSLNEIYPKEKKDYKAIIKASEKQAKSIFIHHYMDKYNFDISRVAKCCHHYPKTNNRIMPICSYNLFHRLKEEKLN